MPIPLSDSLDDCCGNPLSCSNPLARRCRHQVGNKSLTTLSACGWRRLPEEGEGGPPPVGTCGQDCGKKLVFETPSGPGAIIPPPTDPTMNDG